MATKPKLTEGQWKTVRRHWELDARKGFDWLVNELALNITGTAIRARARRDKWEKTPGSMGQADPSSTGLKGFGKIAKIKPATEQSAPPAAPKTSAKPRKATPKPDDVLVGSKLQARQKNRTLPPDHQDPGDRLQEDPDKFGTFAHLQPNHEIFVREYVATWNGSKAAIAAGFSRISAPKMANELLKRVEIRSAIQELVDARARRLGIDGDELLRLWAAMLAADANELTQHRRVCCPYCHTTEPGLPLYTPAQLEHAKRQHLRDRARLLRGTKGKPGTDIGEFPEYTRPWFDKRQEINPECMECFGDGIGEVWIADTRQLSPTARLIYAGVKEGKEGIEILTMSREKAGENLARALGVFRDPEVEVNFNIGDPNAVRKFEDVMAAARERQRVIQAERGLLPAPPPEEA